ncbi:MAG: hypothetical protein OEY55_05450 [Acidimicrobiia bacterium]|nr:hypothetical protein [Acidimicrobiia bacterium]MDH5504051.1 hypothetical protein [Acidimicrobiia bacterium]
MMRLQLAWRGWVTVALALSLAAAVILADIQIQNTVELVHAAAVADADEGRASLQEIDDLVGRTLAAIELSVLAADSAGNVTLDTQTKRKLAFEVDAIAAAAEGGLAVALDRSIDLDARLDTLRVLSATPSQRLITPDVISLQGTVAEAANTANALLADEGTLTSDQINSMRGRLVGAKILRAEVDERLTVVTGGLDAIRSTIRWRVHLVAAVALLSLVWFGYLGWQSAVSPPAPGESPKAD